MKIFIGFGIDLGVLDESGYIPLMLTARFGQKDMVSALLEAGMWLKSFSSFHFLPIFPLIVGNFAF